MRLEKGDWCKRLALTVLHTSCYECQAALSAKTKQALAGRLLSLLLDLLHSLPAIVAFSQQLHNLI